MAKKVVKKSKPVKKTVVKKSIPAKSKAQKPAKAIQASNALPDFDFENVPHFDDFKKNLELPDLESLDEPPSKNEIPQGSFSLEADVAPNVPKDPASAYPPQEKRGFLSKLFGGKKQEKVEVPVEPINMPTMPIFKDPVMDSPVDREKEMLDAHKRRLDQDHRERVDYVREQESALKDKHEELLSKEEVIAKREIDVEKKEKVYAQMNKLKEELENQQISLEYQKQHIEELKSELALKGATLREKEIELDKREKMIADLEKKTAREEEDIRALSTQVNEEDDAIEYLQKEIEKQRKDFENQMRKLQLDSQQENPAVQEIHTLITQCYVELSQKNMAGVKQVYGAIREKYPSIKKYDQDGAIYKDILKLYEDIGKGY